MMARLDRSIVFLGSFASAVALCGASAFAQTAQTAQASEDPLDRQPADIVVTAQRRNESLVDVPVSITAISSDSIAKQAISTERDLQIAVPGLTVRAAFNSDQLNYSIRGQTIDPFTYSQPGVLPYVNDYAVPAGFASSALFDLDSIQVLKGPQGTLFGRNAIGGAVLFTTAKPTHELGGYAKARVGDFDLREFEGAINLPMTEAVVLRVSGRNAHSGGYFRNLTTGNRVGKRTSNSLRGSLLFEPSDVFSNTLVADYTKTSGTTTPGRIFSQYPLGATNNGIALSPNGSFLFSPAVDSLFGPGFFAAYIAGIGLTGTPAAGGLTAYFNSVKNDDPNSDVRLNNDPTVAGKVYNLINTTVFKAGDDTTIKAIVGYTDSKSNSVADSDGTPFDIQTATVTANIKQVSAELQLAGKALGGNLEYVTGLYYVNNRTVTNLGGPKGPGSVFSFAPVGPTLNAVTLRGKATNEAKAAYAQGTYSLTDALKITAGARYTNETQKLRQLPGGLYFGLFGASPQSETIDRVNYQGIIQYFINSRAQVYGKVGSSFRSGGFNIGSAPRPGTAVTGGNGFLPESTTAFELGAKFQGRLGNAPTRLTIAVFQQDVKDVQRAVYATPPGGTLSGFTANIPKSRIKGVEFEGYISPAPWLQIGANAAVVDPKFTQATAIFFGTPKTYGPYPDTPKFSGSVYAQVDVPLANDFANLSLRGEVYNQSKTFFSSLNDTSVPGTEIAAYTVANFRVGLENIGKTGFTIAAYLKNAFDEKYYAGGIPVGEVFSVNSAVPGAPRTYFIEASYKF